MPLQKIQGVKFDYPMKASPFWSHGLLPGGGVNFFVGDKRTPPTSTRKPKLQHGKKVDALHPTVGYNCA